MRVRATAYDLESRRAYRMPLRHEDGAWVPEAGPVPAHDGGPRAEADPVSRAIAAAMPEWQRRNAGVLDRAAGEAARRASVRAARSAAALEATARSCLRAARRHARETAACRRASERALAGIPAGGTGPIAVARGNVRGTVTVGGGQFPVRLAMPGPASVDRDGRIDPGPGRTVEVAALLAEAARKRPEVLAPIARMAASRLAEESCRARASEASAAAAALLAAAGPRDGPAAAPDDAGGAGGTDDLPRVPWSRCACLSGSTVRVTLHDLVRAAQVVAIADSGDGTWVVRPVKAVYPFAARRRSGEAFEDLDPLIAELARAHALAHPEDLAAAGTPAPRLVPPTGGQVRTVESVGDTSVGAASTDTAGVALRDRLAVLREGLSRRGRTPATLPYAGTINVAGKAWVLTAVAGDAHVTLSSATPVDIGGESLRPGFRFTPDGSILGPDDDARKALAAGGAWTMWVEREAVNAAAAMAEAVVGRIGAEIEAAQVAVLAGPGGSDEPGP